jgi:predicted dinucleotide-binding enzyme
VAADEIGRDADILIVATPYAAAADALRRAGDITGKAILDITLPLTADMSGLTIGHSTSAGEEIQKAVPAACVVKGFTTIFAQVLGAGSNAGAVQVFYAGDDAAAKARVRTVIENLGFEAVDAGPLANARYLEPLGMLNVYLGYVAGRGTRIAPAIVSAD